MFMFNGPSRDTIKQSNIHKKIGVDIDQLSEHAEYIHNTTEKPVYKKGCY